MNFSLRFINFNSFVNKSNPYYLNLSSPDQSETNPQHFSKSGWISDNGFKSGLTQIFKYIIIDEKNSFGKLTLSLDDDYFIIENKVKFPKELDDEAIIKINNLTKDYVIKIKISDGLIHARSLFKQKIFEIFRRTGPLQVQIA